MRNKLIIGIMIIILMLSVTACGTEQLPDNDEKMSEKGNGHVTNSIEYEYTEEGLIKPEIAEEVINKTSDQVIKAIKEKDMAVFSDSVHPDKGVRFTPYTYVSVEDDIVFTKEELSGFFANENKYLWGQYDGTGDEIRLTPDEYYKKFIYSADFAAAEQVAYNEVLSFGNMLENQFEIYENAIVVEYYFPGFEAKYEGMDWKSLRLAFQEYEGTWYLVGVIHNQWTI